MKTSKKHHLALRVILSIIGFTNIDLAFSTTLTEAPTGYTTPTQHNSNNKTSTSNGYPEPAGDTFVYDQYIYEKAKDVASGLGPVYNATSCGACHNTPVIGGAGNISVTRAGVLNAFQQFQNPSVAIDNRSSIIADRSLINYHATCTAAQEQIPAYANIIALRLTTSSLGEGYVEAIPDKTLIVIAHNQPLLSQGRINGEYIEVPIMEAPNTTGVGRFGWKDQHASLLSFSGDAHLNEMGITNKLFPKDITTICNPSKGIDDVPDKLGLTDIEHFTIFTRGTLAPPRVNTIANTRAAIIGSKIFTNIGCAICHVPTLVTAPPGTVINGGTYSIPPALGNKIIHPYGDFLLHNIGCPDGIVQNGPPDTANKIRTAQLWGLSTRNFYMHDGKTTSINDAILRHKGEAAYVTKNYLALTPKEQKELLTFLNSL